MKISCEILSVETIGDCLRVKLQGRTQTGAEWRPYLSISLEVPATTKSKRSYYVGRFIGIEVKTL